MANFRVTEKITGIVILSNVENGGSLGVVYLDSLSLVNAGVDDIVSTSTTTGGIIHSFSLSYYTSPLFSSFLLLSFLFRSFISFSFFYPPILSSLFLLLILILIILLLCTESTTGGSSNIWVYQDSLSSFWIDQSWSNNFSFSSTSFIHSGTYHFILFNLFY